MKNHWLVLCLTLTLTVSAQDKDNLKFYTVKDSTYSLWTSLPDSKCDATWEEYMVDAAGDLFKIGTRWAENNRPMKLTSKGWITWDKGMEPTTNIIRLETDGRGLIFASSKDNHIYLLKDTAWKELPVTADGAPPQPWADGGLYALRDPNGGKETYNATQVQVMRWSETGYQHCGANGTALFLKNTSDRYMVDRKGRIFSYGHHAYGSPKGPVEVYIYENGDWKSIGKMPSDITFKGFDSSNNLYVNGWDDQYKEYFKKWDGTTWTDLVLPDKIKLDIGILFDEELNLYVKGKDTIDDHDQAVLFRYAESGWKEVARSDRRQTVDKFIPTSTDIYAVMWKDKMVQKYAGRWIVRKMDIAEIPVDSKVKASPEYNTFAKKELDRIKLFRKDGKLGVQNMDGGIWVHPVFDKITCAKTPQHMLRLGTDERRTDNNNLFCLQMILGKDTSFVPIDQFYGTPFAFQVKAFRKRVSSTCDVCHGSGKTPDRQVDVVTRGAYVKGKSSYSSSGENVWYPSCNCYVYTTTSFKNTSSDGYYEDDKHETRTIKGGDVCPACEGKGTFYAYELYEYDYTKDAGGFYVKKWR